QGTSQLDVTPTSLGGAGNFSDYSYLANHRDDNALTHIFAFDDNLAAFSSNQVAATSFTYFEVSGSTPATNDIHYFGSTDGPFHHLLFEFTGTAAAAANWEYWDGDSWEVLDLGGQAVYQPEGPVGFIAILSGNGSGMKALHISNVSDWASTTINGQAAHWIRAILTGGTNTTAQQTRIVLAYSHNYIEFANTEIDGDMFPLVQLDLLMGGGEEPPTAGGVDSVNRFIFGLKSRGTSFSANIIFDETQMGTITTGSWSRTLSGDSSEVADPDGPAGIHINCDFTTSEALISRVQMKSGATALAHYLGEYRIFVRCQQIGGSVGDTSIKVRTSIFPTTTAGNKTFIDSDVVALTAVAGGLEVVDMGTIAIPFHRVHASDTTEKSLLAFDVFAKSDNGTTPDIEIDDIFLMPIDEGSWVIDAPVFDVTSGGLSLDSESSVTYDSGILNLQTLKATPDKITSVLPLIQTLRYTIGSWDNHGNPPLIEPSKQYRIYYFGMHYNGAWGTGPFIAPLGLGILTRLNITERWATLRGSD
ncbi:hypothetical protein LCGC14_1515660, partial [marine sediment metagenome]